MRPVKIVHKALLKNTNWRPLLVDVAIVANSWQLKSKQTVFSRGRFFGGRFFRWPVFPVTGFFPVAVISGGRFFWWSVFPVTGSVFFGGRFSSYRLFPMTVFPVAGFSGDRFFQWPVFPVAGSSGSLFFRRGGQFFR